MSTTKWAIDAAHSNIGFKVKHLLISTVSGHFGTFSGEAETEGDDFSSANVRFTAEVASVKTNDDQRDGHLKTEQFFDAEKFPQISFNGKLDGTKLTGALSIHGETKEVTLNVEFNGVATDPYGNEKAGFEITGTINRNDFGLTFNVPVASGGVVIGEDVKLWVDIQLLKQKAA